MANPLYDTLFGRHAGQQTPFLIQPDGGVITHDAFLQRAAQFAHALTGLGAVPGDRVCVQVDKSADALALYAACAQAGLVYLPLNTAYTGDEVAYFLENSGASVFVTRPGAPVQHPTQTDLGSLGDGGLAELAQRQPTRFDVVARDIDDLAAFLYTSGTTGRSKGAMLTQGNLLSNAKTLADLWRFTARDVLLHALPIFHTHGLFVGTNITLIAGGAMILLPKFDPDEVLRLIGQATTMMGVPTFYTRLLEDPRFDRALVAHMRLFVSGSAPLLAETHRQFEERTGRRILERYGMTETNMNCSNPYDGQRRAGTVGFPLPGIEVKVTDPATGTELPQGEIGQIEVRGPNVFKGYWQMPEKTAEELRADGFFITGDLGLVDDQGYLQIVGRNKDLIISGGYNIYPKEIEVLLDDQPGVLESAVFGVPHADFGEAVMAVVVADGPVDTDALMAAARKSLARFKHPRKIIVVDSLPRNAMSKVQKNVLRDTYRDS